MSEPVKDAWNEVAEGFAKLGSVIEGPLPQWHGRRPGRCRDREGQRPASSGCGRRSSGSSRPAETSASGPWMCFVMPM